MEEFPTGSEDTVNEPTSNTEETPKSYSEHMQEVEARKSFEDAKRDGELSEDIRDEKDYRDYLEEESAKEKEYLGLLKESREFAARYYKPDKYTNHNEEDLEDFISSQNLETITKYGFSLPWLVEKGVISSSDEWTNDGGAFGSDGSYWRHFKTDGIFYNTRNVVGELAWLCNNMEADANGDRDRDINHLKEIISKNSQPDTLELSDYEYLLEASGRPPFGSGLIGSIFFGNKFDNEPHEDLVDKSVYAHTTHILDLLANRDIQNESHPRLDEYVGYIISESRRIVSDAELTDMSAQHKKNLKTLIGMACHKNMPYVCDELWHELEEEFMYAENDERRCEILDTNSLKQIILQSATKTDIFGPDLHDLKVPVYNRDGYATHFMPVFSETELLESVYSLESNSENLEKYIGLRDVPTGLIRDFPSLLKAGFGRKHLIDTMCDNNEARNFDFPHYGEDEAKVMRENGMTDAEIAYILSSGMPELSPGYYDSGAVRAISLLGISNEDKLNGISLYREHLRDKYHK